MTGKERINVSMDHDIVAKARKVQAKVIEKTSKNVSLSKVVETSIAILDVDVLVKEIAGRMKKL